LFIVVLAKAADLIEWHFSACKWQELSCVIHTFRSLICGRAPGASISTKIDAHFDSWGQGLSFLAMIHLFIEREMTVTAAFCI
jgi:hypothetical protein